MNSLEEKQPTQYILKEKLEELIDGQKVLAVLFHSFNFDPVFFENYIMPVFIKDGEFSDIAIYNKILWRKYQKDDRIPPITVYCDYYAKDKASAPSLGYDIRCVLVPEQKGKICNFHPKHIFILIEDKKSKEKNPKARKKLIMLTGSGNLTASGWCDNFEVFAINEFIKNRKKPTMSNKNLLQQVIINTAKVSNNPFELTYSEFLINEFLNYVEIDTTFNYHHSHFQSFSDFLNFQIPENAGINKIEIISPYFSSDNSLIELLRNRYQTAEIQILLPRVKSDEVMLKKEDFERLSTAGITWCNWHNDNLNREVRNLHAKIYQFYGKEKVYTIIGSVNFTKPAWDQYSEVNNKANFESAVLYKSKLQSAIPFLRKVGVQELENLNFVDIVDLESNETEQFDRNAPEIDFEIDWKERTLKYILINNDHSKLYFKNILSGVSLNAAESTKRLSQDDINVLSSNTIIGITRKIKGKEFYYSYYPSQKNIEVKPFDFKLSVFHILNYWRILGDEEKSNQVSLQLMQQITDESGIVRDKLLVPISVLNEMASYFNALIKLEEHLFPKKKEVQIKELRYYLLEDNVDTIGNCLEALQKDKEKGKHKGLYWMVLQILLVNFYEKTSKLKLVETDESRVFISDIKNKIKFLKKNAFEVAKEIPGMEDKKVQEWVINELKKQYA